MSERFSENLKIARPGWWMYGGNIARTSDSRFYQATQYPLKIHDRRER